MNFLKGFGKNITTLWFSGINFFVMLPLFIVAGIIGGAIVGFFHALSLWRYNVRFRKEGDWTLFYSEIKEETKP